MREKNTVFIKKNPGKSIPRYSSNKGIEEQVFIYPEVKDGTVRLKLDQKANLHNPVRFVFPSFTPDPAVTVTYLNVDFGDGMGPRSITSGSTVAITYRTYNPSGSPYNAPVSAGGLVEGFDPVLCRPNM